MPPTYSRRECTVPCCSWRKTSSPQTNWDRSSSCPAGNMLLGNTSHNRWPAYSATREPSELPSNLRFAFLSYNGSPLPPPPLRNLYMSQQNSMISFQSNTGGNSPLYPPFSGSLYRAGSSPSLNQTGSPTERLSLEDRIRHSLRVRLDLVSFHTLSALPACTLCSIISSHNV